MKTWLLISFTSLISILTFPQNPAPVIVWQKCLGGSKIDKALSIIPTRDNGFLVVGYSLSDDGQVTGHHGSTDSTDAWVLKLNQSGVLEWQQSFGGTRNDQFLHAIETANGDFICVGRTESVNGDVTGLHTTILNGQLTFPSDLWAVRITNTGNIVWSKVYGGTSLEHAQVIRKAFDGGYVISGDGASADFDVTGNHGWYDIWVLKIDDQGMLQWEKSFGNSNSQFTTSLTLASDSTYLISGYQIYNDQGDVGPPVYSEYLDASLKMDKEGNPLWENYPLFPHGNPGYSEYISDLLELPSGQLFSVGNSVMVSLQAYPRWRFRKINSSNGKDIKIYSSQSEQEYVNRQYTGPETAKVLADSSILTCLSAHASGLYADGTLTLIDSFDIYLQGFFKFKYQKFYGGTKEDYFTGMSVLSDGEYIVCGTTNSNDGDVSGNHGDYDFWVVRLNSLNTIKGRIFIDDNRNGIKDSSETYFSSAKIESTSSGTSVSSITDSLGRFVNYVDVGNYSTQVQLSRPYYTVNPSAKQSFFGTYNKTDSFGFAVAPIPGKRDLRVKLLPLIRLRLNSLLSYQVQYSNEGTVGMSNVVIRLIKPERMTFLSATPAPFSVTKDSITWYVDVLNLRENSSINIQLQADPPLNLGDQVSLVSTIEPFPGDETPGDNRDTLVQTTVGASDPNYKMENTDGLLTPEQVSNGKEIVYTIRFQNTGTDTAFNIIVRDTLDSKLDSASIEMVAASHDYQIQIKNGKYLAWTLKNVMLVDSNENEPASHGYISYSVKPKDNLLIGDTIKNSASIYFDFDLPVRTNKQLTVVQLAPIAQPIVTGITNNYCGNQGIQKGKITNLPESATGTTVSVKLDSTVLNISAEDSTFSFDVGSLSEGQHTITVTFGNVYSSKTTSINFTITQALTPDVNVSANITTILSLTDVVIVTAANTNGGGTTPLYTFAKDRTFTNILQAEGTSNTLNIVPSTLTVGENWIYVRMKTSSNCFIIQTNVDSIKLVRDAATGIVDVDYPNHVINIYPNPFTNELRITGLNTSKEYSILIYNLNGQLLLKKRITNRTGVQINTSSLWSSTLVLSIYDEKKKRTLGTMKLQKK